jgi:hypothetical protein
MLKGMFIGLAVKAAKALGEALKAGFDFAREMGVSLSSMPLAVGLAREEATALLEEFGSLKDMTSANLLNMKWNAYWYGVSGADSAKLLKLQMSITDSTKEMALEDQRDFMKELKDEGLSASKVMSDMAGHSEFIAKYMKDGGDNMEAAAKYAASIGVDLGVAESMADKLLDWESSIAAEMEASMILGRSINLDKARQLAYDGKIKEMLVEAKIQAGGEAEFAKMTAIQRESLGDALGLNASQMAEFVKEQDIASESAAKFHWGWVAIMGGIGTAIGLLIAAKNQLMALNPVVGAAKTKVDMGLIAKGGGRGLAMGIGAGAAAATGAYAMGRASGGPVKAGNPYVVGERGSELFVPMTGGSIIPHAAGGAGPAIDNSDITSRMDKQFEQNERLFRKLGSQFEYGTGQH